MTHKTKIPTDQEILEWAEEEQFFLFCDEDELLDIVRSALIRYMRPAIKADRQRRGEPVAESQQWQPIDSAPLDGESVLLYYGPEYYVMEGRCFKRERGCRKNVYYQWITAIDMGELEPTHWMPLPAPPSTT